MPDIFRGIDLDPLQPGNFFYLLWMILGFQIVSSVLVVSLGRLGDMFGRVRMYNFGFVLFTLASLVLTVDPLHRAGRRHVADRRAHLPGHGRRLPDGQLRRHPHRRLPGQPARAGAGHQQHRRHQRLLHGPGAGRRAGGRPLAAGVPGIGAVRPVRHRVVLLQAARGGRAPPRPHRLGRQYHLRGRADPGDDRHHRWHPAGQRPRDGLDQLAGDRRCWPPASPALAAFAVIELRDQRPDVPAAAVPHQGLHLRHGRRPSCPRWRAAG